MTEIALMLHLGQAQAEQLAEMCVAYRAYAWRALEPTPERNQTMRAIQAVQGRVSQARAAGMGTLRLALCEEERQALRQVMVELLQMYGKQIPSEERNRVLGTLAVLRLVLEQACRQAWAW